MKIQSNINYSNYNQNFTAKIPTDQAIILVSGEFVPAYEKALDKSVKKIINRELAGFQERYKDYNEARSILVQICPNLLIASEKFKNEIARHCISPYALTKEDTTRFLREGKKGLGSKFIVTEQ